MEHELKLKIVKQLREEISHIPENEDGYIKKTHVEAYLASLELSLEPKGFE